jgi:hypothetical protein
MRGLAMPDQSQLELAKQGDPQAIAAVINNSLKSGKINADVFREDNSLHIMLEGDKVPASQEKLVTFLRNGLTKLDIASIYTVKVYGRQLGDDPAWEEEIVLKMPPPGAVGPDSFEPDEDEDLDVEDPLMDEDEEAIVDADDEEIDLDEEIVDEDEDDYNPEEDDDPDDDKTEEVEPRKSPNKLLLLIPVIIIVAIAALAGLHFSGIFPLPFLPGGSSESEPAPIAPPPEDAAPTEPPAGTQETPAEAPAQAADPWRDAVNAAMSAAELAQTAQSQVEWNAVADEWQKAGELMGQVPESSPNYQTAQQKAQEYAQNQQIARQRAASAPN